MLFHREYTVTIKGLLNTANSMIKKVKQTKKTVFLDTENKIRFHVQQICPFHPLAAYHVSTKKKKYIQPWKQPAVTP